MDVLFLAGAESPVAAAGGLARVAAGGARRARRVGRGAQAPRLGRPRPGGWRRDQGALGAGRGTGRRTRRRGRRRSPCSPCAPRGRRRLSAARDSSPSPPPWTARAGRERRQPPLLARAAAAVLARARPGGNGDPGSLGVCAPALPPDHPAFAALARVLTPTSPLPGRGWYPCAEQAIAALYALHPDPEGVAADIVRVLRRRRVPRQRGENEGKGDTAPASGIVAAHLARFYSSSERSVFDTSSTSRDWLARCAARVSATARLPRTPKPPPPRAG